MAQGETVQLKQSTRVVAVDEGSTAPYSEIGVTLVTNYFNIALLDASRNKRFYARAYVSATYPGSGEKLFSVKYTILNVYII